MAEATKRVRRSREELIKDLESKIAKEKKDSEDKIKKLQDKIDRLKNPPKRKLTKAEKQKKVNEAIKAAKMSPEAVAEKLGLNVDF